MTPQPKTLMTTTSPEVLNTRIFHVQRVRRTYGASHTFGRIAEWAGDVGRRRAFYSVGEEQWPVLFVQISNPVIETEIQQKLRNRDHALRVFGFPTLI